MSQKSRSRSRSKQQAAANQRRQVARQPPDSLDPAAVVQQAVQSMTIAAAWQGPIPPPEALDKYERVEPGLAGRIVTMAERAVDMAEGQMHHRIDMERRMIVGHNRRASTGLWIAALLAVLVLGGSLYTINQGHDSAGTIVASVDLVGLCGVFIYGRYDQNRREQDRTSS